MVPKGRDIGAQSRYQVCCVALPCPPQPGLSTPNPAQSIVLGARTRGSGTQSRQYLQNELIYSYCLGLGNWQVAQRMGS